MQSNLLRSGYRRCTIPNSLFVLDEVMPSITERKEFIRPTQLIVELDRIAENYRLISEHCQSKVMAVLKANAYGHGIIETAKRLEAEGADYFGVAVLEEGILLREEGIKAPILVFGGILFEQVDEFIENELTITASSIEKLLAIEATAQNMKRRAKVHLKIDTGMGRIGVQPRSAKAFFEAALSCDWIDVEGVYSHFASADAVDLIYTQKQWNRFQKVLECADNLGLEFQLRHICNSGGILQVPEGYLDMVRAGILLYGVHPVAGLERRIAVQPALTWKTRVVFFKVIEPEQAISYGSNWQADQLSRIVTLPVGYGDGYHRIMSHKAEVLIRGCRYPVVGNICMDQIMVNIGWETAYNGDEVVLLGRQGDRSISVEELALWAQTIPYEILTSINQRVSRVYQ